MLELDKILFELSKKRGFFSGADDSFDLFFELKERAADGSLDFGANFKPTKILVVDWVLLREA